jgi:PhzF family phenazine biosynthesis protein
VLDSGVTTPRDGRLVQQCAAGLVTVHVEPGGTRLAFEVPPARAEPVGEDDAAAIARALRLDGPVPRFESFDVGPVWLTAELAEAPVLRALRPDFDALDAISRRLGATGVTVHARVGAPDAGPCVAVRSFAPAAGAPEDPVCGSGNACVALQRRARGLREPYVASQGEALGRAGRIAIRYVGDAIEVGGETVVCIEGRLRVA